MITALLVTCLPVCRALGKYSQVAGESVHSSHCKLLPVSRFCRLQAFGLKSHLPGDCLSNQGRGITVGTAHIIKNPAWRSRNGVPGCLDLRSSSLGRITANPYKCPPGFVSLHFLTGCTASGQVVADSETGPLPPRYVVFEEESMLKTAGFDLQGHISTSPA